MKKISILSQNIVFAEDFARQIQIILPEAEVVLEKEQDIDLYFVDEDENILKSISEENSSTPIVLFSRFVDSSEFADVVILKPFSMVSVLNSLKEGKLLPKIRRKECLMFKEYSFYPVKKEIVSSKTNETIKLTEKEVRILKYLYDNQNLTISKDDLLENVWGYCAEMTTHTIETHIYRLRQKVEQKKGSQIIITENNGYRINI